MKPWFEQNPKLLQREKEVLASAYPTLEIAVRAEGCRLNSQAVLKKAAVVAQGVYSLRTKDGTVCVDYGLKLVYPPNYPRSHPVVYCDDPKLPIGILDRHILSNGQACLGVPTDIRRRWQQTPDIISFLDTIIAPFLAWQVHYDAFGSAPPWGERAHFGRGVIQYYAELLGLPETANIIDFMRLLARKNSPKGHEPCPCGSGKNIRTCNHRNLVETARTMVRPDHAMSALLWLLGVSGADKSRMRTD